jgi:adiponectin receptor
MTPAKQSRKRSTSKPRAKAAPTFEVLETSPITSPKPAVTAAVSAEPNPWRLRKIHEVEEWQRFNPFILSGYRYRYTVAMCMRSLFMVHNETGNVWTHLIGFAIFVSLAWHVISSVIEVSVWHYTVFFFYMLTNMLCMGSSTVYHLMSCHSEWLMRATLFVDFFGISALITGSFIPPIFYVFTCYPWLRMLYLSQITILGGATLVAPWFKFFNSEEWQTRRVLLYVVTIASGLAPTGHLLFLFPPNLVTAPVHLGILLMFLFYGVGTIIYVTRLPESLYPGQFDIWFNSHQLWHIFVLAASVVHFFTCIGIYQRFSPGTC